jgi:hypothetical protein
LGTTMFLLGLILVSLFHHKWIETLVSSYSPSNLFFWWEMAHQKAPKVWRKWPHSMARSRLHLLVPKSLEIFTALKVICMLISASNEMLLWANTLFEYEFLTWLNSSLSHLQVIMDHFWRHKSIFLGTLWIIIFPTSNCY